MTPSPELDDVPGEHPLRTYVVDGHVYIHMVDMADFLRKESVVIGERHRIKPRFLAPVFELLGIGVDRCTLYGAMSALTQMADVVDRMRRKALARYEASLKEGETG